MRIFPQIRGNHASDREFQFGFGEFWFDLTFQKKQIYGNGEFLRVFRILEQPPWQHGCVHTTELCSYRAKIGVQTMTIRIIEIEYDNCGSAVS